MIIKKIYINGQIGSTEDSKGVELQDVIMQVEANKDADVLHIHINSPGGSVNTGRLIAEYISKLSNAITIAEGLCGSIATEIHLAVPVEKRKIIAGTQYFIHNPLLQGISGNASELLEASEYVKVYQTEMLRMYVSRTGTDKAAIEGLMNAETSLTDDQCIKLGFVSEIIAKQELKAVAFLDKKIKIDNNKNFDMSKIAEEIKKGFATLKAEIGIKKEVTAGMIVTDGGELSYASEGELPEVGEVVMMGEEIAAEGVYIMENGTVVTVVAEGVVESVVPMEEEEEETVEALKLKIEALETAHAEEMKEMNETFTSQMDALKVEIGSNFVPKAEKKVFAKKIVKKTLTMREKVAARKEELKK